MNLLFDGVVRVFELTLHPGLIQFFDDAPAGGAFKGRARNHLCTDRRVKKACMKTQAMNAGSASCLQRPVFRTPLKMCACCGNKLPTAGTLVAATKYGFAPPQKIMHVSTQCTRRQCRSRHGYNYVWMSSMTEHNGFERFG